MTKCAYCGKRIVGRAIPIWLEHETSVKAVHEACLPDILDRCKKPQTKVTANKPKLAYTFRSTMECIAAVREYATNGPYKDPNNWKEVKDEDWDQALLRHVMAYLEAKRGNGSVYDGLSHIHHLAHVLTTVGFLMENHVVRDGKPINER